MYVHATKLELYLPEHKGKDERCQRNYVQEYDGVGCRRILQAIVV
jgi:hypothetical protein